ncbi:MAG: DUF3520 domain-containing protein [Tabrizicola sp.]|nr:DUF3520 domain-containing protein [Tabrizicola sp.]
MTDELDDLRAALKAMPGPDQDAKARAMALAMENFDRLQGSPQPARPSQDRPARAGILNGARNMLNFLTSRPALAATTSIAALIIGVTVILPVTNLKPGNGDIPVTNEKPSTEAKDGNALATGATDTETAVLERAPSATDPAADPAAEASVAPQEPLPEPAAPEKKETAAAPAESPTSLAEAAQDEPADTQAVEKPMVEESVAEDMVIGESELRLRATGEADAGLADTLTTYLPAPTAAAPDFIQPLPENTEAYASTPANPVKVTAEEPVSTFSIDVDTASYAVIRSTLNGGSLPAAEQVRIEEMINYFPYDYPAPEAGEAPFKASISVMETPWNPGTRLVGIGLQGALPAAEDRPALNLVFLIDTSGSMEDPNKLGLLKKSLALMLAELRPEDEIAIVAYAGSAGEVLPPTRAENRTAILAALENLSAGGSTAGAEGLELAYRVAEGMAKDGEVSRILLATDGDFNVGVSDPEGLEAYVAKKRESGTYLSVLGFGRGNLDDVIMQSLAQNGNGTAAYIDTLSEARKVLVDQLTGALFPIADDVKIQIEWNPAQVAEYRLIGYETRALAREDFNNDKVDAGEIGAGTQVTAIYEITAPGSSALRNDPLRYGAAAPATDAPEELGFLKLRYKAPGEASSTLVDTPITGRETASDSARFAAAMAGFGQLLQGSVYLGDWGWDEAIALAVGARGEDPFGYRAEAVNLMRLAESLGK